LMLHVHDARLLSAEYDDYDVETSDHWHFSVLDPKTLKSRVMQLA
jgi:hypothetical protein